MNRSNHDGKRRKLKLNRERLRQLDNTVLDQVAGGWDWYRTCMGTWATAYYC